MLKPYLEIDYPYLKESIQGMSFSSMEEVLKKYKEDNDKYLKKILRKTKYIEFNENE